MWRGFFLAIGIYMMILGAECLGVEKVNLKAREAPPPQNGLFEQKVAVGPQKTYLPPRWVPWSFMSSGAVVCLYSFSIPTRLQGKK